MLIYMTYTTETEFNHNHDGSLICRHRDLSCCDACAAAHIHIVNVYGAHFWIDDAAERDALAEIMA